MRRLSYLQLDVFTETPFTGNQLAVFLDAEGLTDDEMQALAKEMNFSESTFVLPASDPQALARVRIFTPNVELPFAGHPTVGTTFALAASGRIQPERDGSPIILELGVGPIPIDLFYEGDGGAQTLSFAWMRQPIPSFSPWQGDAARLAAALGLAADDLATDLPIERGSAGVAFVYIPLRSAAALARTRPNADLAAALGDASPQVGAFIFTLDAPDAVGAGTGDAGVGDGGAVNAPVNAPFMLAVRGRMFAPFLDLREDPATGSAAGPLGAYLVRHGRASAAASVDGEARVRLTQGVEMGRPSRLDVAVAMTGGDQGAASISGVRVGGASVVVAEGVMLLP
ncbi:MAG TPA: PhzF family phenazine biosynthesis protein [Ktedonobacterales bacterium]|nr:PhzF family phenazine biosynthesis protein [Ktedonobacterales bacterium]